jgi:hypothetical protein
MARPRVLRSGIYTQGGPSLVDAWTLATGAVPGVLGKSPMQWLGWYDLKPWQDTPEGAGLDDYRQNVVAVETGQARVRFSPVFAGANESGRATNPIALPTAGTYTNVQLGARCELGPLTWQPEDDVGNTRTVQAVSLLVVGVDSPELTDSWSTSIDQTWPQMDTAATAGQTRTMIQNYVSVGPEILTDLAQGPAATYDLNELGGGTRFVGVWAVGYWVGPDVNAAQVGAVLNWQVEDGPGPYRYGSTTYAYPVRRVAALAGANSDADPTRTVAQWSLQRFGSSMIGNTTGAPTGVTGCSVVVVNGGVQLDARVDYHVGTAVDKTASPSANMTVIPAGTATVPSMVRLPNAVTGVLTTVNGPYSYGSLCMVCGSGVAPPNATDTVAMVLVTVG